MLKGICRWCGLPHDTSYTDEFPMGGLEVTLRDGNEGFVRLTLDEWDYLNKLAERGFHVGVPVDIEGTLVVTDVTRVRLGRRVRDTLPSAKGGP